MQNEINGQAGAIREIERITREAEAGKLAQISDIGGRVFTSKQLIEILPPEPKAPAVLVVATLGALASYLRANRDEIAHDKCMLHVVSPTQVDLIMPAGGRSMQRVVWLSAQTHDRLSGFVFGHFYSREDLQISLQTRFQDKAGDHASTLKLLGNVKDEDVAISTDDGFSQVVELRGKIAVSEGATTADVKNPRMLAPFRTFAEVDQPISPYVLRFKKGPTGVQAALIEADGGGWRLAATEAIAKWLSGAVPPEVAILA